MPFAGVRLGRTGAIRIPPETAGGSPVTFAGLLFG